MGENDSTTETVRRLIALVVEHGLEELVVEEGDLVVGVKAGSSPPPGVAAPQVIPVGTVPHLHPAGPAPVVSHTLTTDAGRAGAPARPSHVVALESPMVGVFYRSPAPDEPAFVQVGDQIQIGQTIGLIEAMKVYSEVPAEAAGRITEIPVETGKLVQQGQPLIYIDPSA